MNFPHRHAVQEHLTSLITQGVIVELGCGYGNGVISMHSGNLNRLPIYSIDPYLPYSDPLGGKYGEDTKASMLINTLGLDFTHIQKDALDAIKDWQLDIGLLWVDLSMTFENLWPIVFTWQRWILPGGYLGITGLEYKQLGTKKIYDMLEWHGYDKMLEEQALVAVMKKR